jgi:hypothetical protein
MVYCIISVYTAFLLKILEQSDLLLKIMPGDDGTTPSTEEDSCRWCIIVSSCRESVRVVELTKKIILTLYNS